MSELKHHGILGMKWGVRRERDSKTGLVTKKIITSPEHKESREIAKKRVSEMTNVELKKFNERMNLEKQYNQLNPTNIDKGKQLVKNILGVSGKTAVTTFATAAILYGGKQILKKYAGQEVVSAMFPKKK